MRSFLGLLLLVVLTSCRTEKDIQRDYAKTLRPAAVEATPTPVAAEQPPQQLRVFKLRVYADADYQAQARTWEKRILNQVQRANSVLGPQFGVRLEVESLRTWDRPQRSSDLHAALEELVSTDSGKDVDWVVGFVSSLQVFAATQDQLGMGAYFSRHFVLRGMDSVAEVQALTQTLDKLSMDERESLFSERRLHKEISVLLHEWAHTLGAFHERSNDWVMSPVYHASQSSFSPESIRIIQASLQHRDAKDAEGRAAWAKAYREEVNRSSAAAWNAQERDHALATAEELLGGTGGAAPSDKLSVADARRFNDAVQYEHSGNLERAAQVLEPLIPRYPKDVQVQQMACYLAHRRAPKAPETVSTCRTATQLAGVQPDLFLLLGHALIDQDDRRGALEALGRAETGLAGGKTEAGTWLYLAGLYQQADTCSGAERVAAHISTMAAAAELLSDCARLRRWTGLPAGSQEIPFEREHEYVAAVREAQTEIDGRRLEQAKGHIQQLEKAFPGAPGPALLTCHLQSRGTSLAKVKSACTAAAKAFAEAVYPRYILGTVAASEGRWKDASSSLARAIELDDKFEAAWARLASVEQRLGDKKGLEELKARYQSRFGRELRVAP
ncbi:MAG: M12 family metallo-peptidase [Hyalangium sp.]|uniref:M12 family metallo-peptidase n=1 Tax=Hyalangium sp. TaxID=2028555 RepID=UPI003899D2F2